MVVIDSRHLRNSIEGEITLNASKSISNRLLIIRALANNSVELTKLSNANDTILLEKLLNSDADVFDAEDAGTTFRFLTAYLAFKPGEQILTGTERMKKRPIKILVDALKNLGADIEYLENEGFPPLKIKTPGSPQKHRVALAANVSSQYISALLLIAPTLPNGLHLSLEGEVISTPYILLTINLMKKFGVDVTFVKNEIIVRPQEYCEGQMLIEADWSAASYYYAFAALTDKANIKLNGLQKNSAQGDAVIADIMEGFGVTTQYLEDGVLLQKKSENNLDMFEYDFKDCPDLAQTLLAVCSAKRIVGLFSGLETLKIKECNRVEAMSDELLKMGTSLVQLPSGFSEDKQTINYVVESFPVEGLEEVEIETYDDHRMAMANACFSLFYKLKIANPRVVDKSYPLFWEDIRSLGVSVSL